MDGAGNDESGVLDTLHEIAGRGRTQADDLVESFRTRWKCSIDPVYEEMRY